MIDWTILKLADSLLLVYTPDCSQPPVSSRQIDLSRKSKNMLKLKQRSPVISLILFVSLVASTFAQQKPTNNSQQPRPTPIEDDETVRITTNLVQVDAVVTDKDGRQVTNLNLNDFEILEDGKPQKITNFSYISSGSSTATPEQKSPSTRAVKDAVPPPPRRLKSDARRIMALVVDDLGLDFDSTVFVRDALKKFVAEEVQSDDLVAIFRTGKDAGVLQQLTTDKQQLYEAIARLRYNNMGREGIDAFMPIEPYLLPQETFSGAAIKDQSAVTNDDVFEEFRSLISATGTLGALNLVIRGLSKLPGRKSVVLFSNGLDFSIDQSLRDNSKYPSAGQTIERAQLLIDQANRASVVIYSVDPRALEAPFNIRDNFAGRSPDQIASALQARRKLTFFKQAGLRELADRTGGFFIGNTNDIKPGLRRIAADLEGYYLIGYRPGESTFDSKTGQRRFHRLEVKVKTRGLRVRTRAGFFSVPDKNDRPLQGDSLAEALISPFAGQKLQLRLTSLLARAPQTGTFMRSLIHVDARDLTFVQEPDGRYKTVFDVAGATFGGNGMIVDKIDQTSYTMRISEKTYQRLQQTGFVYTVDFPVKKPGAYQLRFSIRDSASQRVGSAGHFVLIPDLERDRIALSGVIIRGRTSAVDSARESQPVTSANVLNPASGQVDERDLESDVQSSPAVRRFSPGTTIDYAYLVYNARTTSASPRPQVVAQVRLYRDGKLIYSGKESQIETAGQEDLKRLSIFGEMQLGNTAAVGEYVLQIIVKDLLAPEKQRIASQWIDFEIVK